MPLDFARRPRAAAALSLTALSLTLWARPADAFDAVTGQAAESVLGQSGFATATPGSGLDQLSTPAAIAVDPLTGALFVADQANRRVLRFASADAYTTGAAAELSIDSRHGAELWGYASGLDVDSIGNLWLTDTFNARVFRVTFSSGSPEIRVVLAGIPSPQGIHVTQNGELYLVTGTVFLRFPGAQSLPVGSTLSIAQGIGIVVPDAYDVTTDPLGGVWVGGGTVRRINVATGTPLTTLGSGWLGGPVRIAFDPDGRLIVSDATLRRVAIWNDAPLLPSGAPPDVMLGQSSLTGTESGTSDTRMSFPLGVAVDPSGQHLFVNDWLLHRVLRFSSRPPACPDGDGDGASDCVDGCPADAAKTAPGVCGCGAADVDSDLDAVFDCFDGCPSDPWKAAPGVCGCGTADVDSDLDAVFDCFDGCPSDPWKAAPGVCGCGTADLDVDGDGAPDCVDACPTNPAKTAPGACGCGAVDTDGDGDGAADCVDGCPADPGKTAPGACGCGQPEVAGCGGPVACVEGATCSDGDACTENDLCVNGACQPGRYRWEVASCDVRELVAAYAFEEGSGELARDATRFGHHGTLSGGVSRAPGQAGHGQAACFDGVDGLVTIAGTPYLQLWKGMTLSAWVKPSAVTGWRTVMLHDGDAGLIYALYASSDTGRPEATINNGLDRHAPAPAALPRNAWTHLAATYDGRALRFYVGGALKKTTSASGHIFDGAGNLTLGGNRTWGEFFAGCLDDVRVYRRALTAAELAADMATAITP